MTERIRVSMCRRVQAKSGLTEVDAEHVHAGVDKHVHRGEVVPGVLLAKRTWPGLLAKLGARLVDAEPQELALLASGRWGLGGCSRLSGYSAGWQGGGHWLGRHRCRRFRVGRTERWERS